MKNTFYTKILKKSFGFDEFRDHQLKIIKAIVEDKKDVCAIMFTGAGKSLCFQFPAVALKKTVIVISPLISLMNDQKGKMDDKNIKTICLNSTVSNKDQIKEEILKNKYRLVYTSPEYIITQKEFLKDLIKTENLLSIVIDEVHCISSWGHDFRESYRQLISIREWIPNIPIMALTATATLPVQEDIIKVLKLNDQLMVKTTFDRPNLIIKICKKNEKPETDLLPLLKSKKATIIYCPKRKNTESLVKMLKKYNIKCDAYHAGMDSLEREIVQNDFMDNSITCIVATVAFGMGIDKIVRQVIHYGLPKDIESYYQEIGRAGRDGKMSKCYLFYSPGDISSSDFSINNIEKEEYRKHKLKLLTIMKKYVYNSECRRKFILNYFGEIYNKDNCKNCDICLNKTDVVTRNFVNEATLYISTIRLTGNKYGSNAIINILRGSNAKTVNKEFKTFKQYGKGSKYSSEWWKIFNRMLINEGYIGEESFTGGYGFSIFCTQKGAKWINDPNQKLELIIPKDMLVLEDKHLSINKDKHLSINKDKQLSMNPFAENNVNISNKEKSTYEITFEFYKQGLTMKDIAKLRKMNLQTIESHYAKLYATGHKIDIKKFGFTNEIHEKISKTMKDLKYPNKLSVLKNALPKNISYFHIKISIEILKEEAKKKKMTKKILD